MSRTSVQDLRRRLPAVDRLLREPSVQRLLELYGRDLVRVQARAELEAVREAIAAVGEGGETELERAIAELPQRIAAGLERDLGPALHRVLNATGIFLHTNLGRSPLPREVASRLVGALDAYCDLELDLGEGRRSDRNLRVGHLLRALTGAEAGLAVNNNAAALVLILAEHAAGREVVVSRGELVEIGGSFRIPDILEASGARLVEVGTTNRTRVQDYERAIGEETALLLKVHPSNYRMSGFVEEVEAAELVELGRRHGLPVVFDEGSGLLRPRREPQLRDHASVADLVAAGCELVCGSGDKVLGGPQAGLIVGAAESVERCRRHPLYRALRPDRACLAALESVLRIHLAGGELPIDRMWADAEAHRERLAEVAGRLGAELGARIVAADAYLGGGAAPDRAIPGEALALRGDEELLARLRSGTPPVVGYLKEGQLILDLRTVDPADEELLVEAVAAAAASR